MVKNCIEIDSRLVGSRHPVYVVAEMSANHHQEYDEACELVRAAKGAGADAIKLQTYKPETMTVLNGDTHFRINGTLWHGKTLQELYSEAHMPWDWQPRLQELAREIELDFFSTPFDDTAVDFLAELDVPVYKVASFENTDLPLLRKIAETGKPIILSTGLATLTEIEDAVRTIQEAGGEELALLKCTSAYPASRSEMHLRTIPNLAEGFQLPVGLSDHTMGIVAPVVAVAMGACIVEKHFTLSRAVPGPDSEFSLEPSEFCDMVRAIRETEQVLGSVHYGRCEEEAASGVFRRSLFVVSTVMAGERFTSSNVRRLRPDLGLPPRFLDTVIGRPAACDIEPGTPLTWGLVGEPVED